MNRQTRTFVVLFVALAAAAAASYGVYITISRMPVRQVEVATRHAVVASRTLPVGTLLTADTVKLIDWPAATPLDGGFDSLDAVVGRGLIANLVENEPLVEGKVAPREAGAGLPPSIPPGMRAMSVKVNEVIGVAGFVVPGTRVDVMVVIHQKDDTISRVVVSNVQVLTAGTKYDQDNAREAKPVPSTVVTLLVAPEDGERIALAQADGQLMLSLRNPTDVAPTETAGARMASLFGQPAPPPAPVKVPVQRVAAVRVEPPPIRQIYTVETIRAAKRTEEVVK
jgi:pilus assembly protein CpaB